MKGLNNSTSWLVPSESISLAMYATVERLPFLRLMLQHLKHLQYGFNDLTKRDILFFNIY